MAIRSRLQDEGFDRLSFSDDNGDGKYKEVWTGILGVVTLDWFPKIPVETSV